MENGLFRHCPPNCWNKMFKKLFLAWRLGFVLCSNEHFLSEIKISTMYFRPSISLRFTNSSDFRHFGSEYDWNLNFLFGFWTLCKMSEIGTLLFGFQTPCGFENFGLQTSSYFSRQWMYQTCTEFGWYQSSNQPGKRFFSVKLKFIELNNGARNMLKIWCF